MIAVSSDALAGVVVALLSGGLIIAVIAYRKAPSEIANISVTAAQGAVIVQTGVIDSLREENAGLREDVRGLRQENEDLYIRVRNLERSVGETAGNKARIEALEQENAELKDENMRLQDRVGTLELQLEGLELNGGG